MTLQEIDDLEARIYGLEMPKAPFELWPGTVITEIEQFLETQFISLRFNPDAKVSLPCLGDWKDLLNWLKQSKDKGNKKTQSYSIAQFKSGF